MSTTELTFLITYLSLVIQIQIHNNYFNVFPKLTEKLDEIENKNNHYDIVIKKLSGMTLEQIGQEYGLTREELDKYL